MAEPNVKLLIIEDDGIVRQFLRGALARQNYVIQEAANGNDGLAKAAQWSPDLVLLDLNLPDIDGLDVAIRLREWMQATKVAALDAGADDYLTKPIGVAELQARLRVALRHARRMPEQADEPVYAINGLRVDIPNRQVFVNEVEVHLTPTEYKLLVHLVRNAGRVVKHRELLHSVWGPQYGEEINYVRIYVKHLRDKIEPDPANPQYILNEPRIGYRFTAGV